MLLLDKIQKLAFAASGGRCVYCSVEIPCSKDYPVFVCDKCAKEEAKFIINGFKGNTLYTAEYKGIIRTLVRRCKFNCHPYYALYMSKLMAETLDKCPVVFDSVTYLPVHAKRKVERGFDLSELLCCYLSLQINAKAETLVKRERFTRPLYGLTKDERTKEVEGAFKCISKKKAQGKRILLIDDISTTGASMNECEKVLSKAKAEVIRFAFAKGGD